MRVGFVFVAFPSRVRTTLLLPSSYRCRPLWVDLRPHGPLPRYSPTMSRSDFHTVVSAPYPLRFVGEYPVSEKLHGSPKFMCLSFDPYRVSDPGREDSISPYRCSPCCLLVSGDYGPLQQVTFRGSIPSLSLRSSYSLRAASSFPVTGYDALLVPGCRLNVTWAGLQPARNHTLILAHPEQLPKMK